MHVQPDFAMKVDRLNERMIVARHFAVDATRLGLKSLDDVLLMPPPWAVEEDYSSVNDLFGMNDVYAVVFVAVKSWLQRILYALLSHQQRCL